MLAQALVPLKSLLAAKSRLSSVLSPAERRSLAKAMAEHVLATLANHPSISTVTVVSDDPSMGALAAKYGTNHLLESSLGCCGLNTVVTRCCDLLFADSDQPIVILHGDLPCLDMEDISIVLNGLAQHGGLVIAIDRHQRGTNLLAFGAENRPELSFGTNSFARHCASAKQRGIQMQVLRLPNVALDIDEPQDLDLLVEEIKFGRKNYLSELFSDTVFGNSIETKLTSFASMAAKKEIAAEQPYNG